MYTLKKSLGQHFLHDENMCKKIVASFQLPPTCQVAEIGPGGGALTKYLLQMPGIVYTGIEIDHEKVEYLLKTYPALQQRLIEADILKADMPYTTPFAVIGNFPYNISSPIMFKLLEWTPMLTSITGMFQKEVALRIAAPPGSKTYGILSVLTQAFYQVEYLFDVHENCFTPPPKVKSGVVRFENIYNPHNIENTKKFIQLVKAAFNQRRKTLRNALKSTVQPHLLSLPVMDKRAEQLNVAEFVDIYRQNYC